MDFNGFQWISRYFNGFPRDFSGFQWISVDLNGFQWISMDFNGFQHGLVLRALVLWFRVLLFYKEHRGWRRI